MDNEEIKQEIISVLEKNGLDLGFKYNKKAVNDISELIIETLRYKEFSSKEKLSKYIQRLLKRSFPRSEDKSEILDRNNVVISRDGNLHYYFKSSLKAGNYTETAIDYDGSYSSRYGLVSKTMTEKSIGRKKKIEKSIKSLYNRDGIEVSRIIYFIEDGEVKYAYCISRNPDIVTAQIVKYKPQSSEDFSTQINNITNMDINGSDTNQIVVRKAINLDLSNLYDLEFREKGSISEDEDLLPSELTGSVLNCDSEQYKYFIQKHVRSEIERSKQGRKRQQDESKRIFKDDFESGLESLYEQTYQTKYHSDVDSLTTQEIIDMCK